MNETQFYSPSQQFKRELRLLARVHRFDTFLGGLYVLAGFYFVRDIGGSQVYDVIAPFVFASLVAGHLSYIVYAPQSRGTTVLYNFGLPRDRTLTWGAQLAYVGCVVLGLEIIILVGTAFKLGGAGMTPVYRLHPELFFFPLIVVAVVLVCVSTNRFTFFWSVASSLILVVLFGLWVWKYTLSGASESNNYLPGPKASLTYQTLVAFALAVFGAFILFLCRRYWRNREVGEIL